MKKVVIFFLLAFSVTGLYAQNFKTIYDLSYNTAADAHEKQQLDLYLPEGISGYPIMIWIHGGAWAFGSRKQEQELASQFASRGIAVAAVSYRLSPGTWADPKFDTGIAHPEHIKDIALAFKWVREHAGTYEYSKEKIFVSGYSAGGHLAALLVTDQHYLEDLGLSTDHIKGVIPIAGAYDIVSYHDSHYRYNGPEMAEKHVKAVFGKTEEAMTDASPTNFVSNLSTPMLLISENQSYDYTKLFENVLKKQQKDMVQYLHVRELNHKQFYANLAQAESSKYRQQIIDFIQGLSALKP
jgi:acetyl esterase/lipase